MNQNLYFLENFQNLLSFTVVNIEPFYNFLPEWVVFYFLYGNLSKFFFNPVLEAEKRSEEFVIEDVPEGVYIVLAEINHFFVFCIDD